MEGSSNRIWEAFHGPNMGYVEEQYELFLDDPDAVDETLRHIFEEHGAPEWMESTGSSTPAPQGEGSTSLEDLKKMTSAMKLVEAIRRHGHLGADIYPVGGHDTDYDSLINPKSYGLSDEDLRKMDVRLLAGEDQKHFKHGLDYINHLKEKYLGTASYEFTHITDDQEREWLFEQVETGAFEMSFSDDDKKDLLKRLGDVEGFEQFLAKTFVAQKRFSIEGLDVMVPMLDHLVKNGNKDLVKHIMLGMAHRGRLNVLAHILEKPYDIIFSEFAHSPNKELVPSEGSTGINYGWTGDVKYHFGADGNYENGDTKTKITLAHNPSHLEFVNPIVEGYTRAVQDDRSERGHAKPDFNESFSVQIHGDAAFIGEGVVAETLNLSELKGYATGGAIHLIANNLVGFTTDYSEGRSTKYASDLAKGFEIPVIHVNADDPITCVQTMEFAYQYRKKFQKDIVIDLVGYRRYGHNEMDEPRGTQPLLYKEIDEHDTAYEVYAKRLTEEKVVSEDEGKSYKEEKIQKLKDIYDNMKENEIKTSQVPDLPKEVADELDQIETKVDVDVLRQVNEDMLKRPEDFTSFKKLEKILNRREKALEEGQKIDWALGEALAFGTILKDGTPIRMTGQDSERGTFAHRHLVLHDNETNEKYSPMHGIEGADVAFDLYNSPLSEVAVLGFEYGYSVQSKDTLVLWEAQYGDFANVAQVIYDQFISSGRAKWGQIASLVMLLPHGYEGQGPEHSSARLERFLQLSAENNWTVANVTTSGQYFHLLRRQAAIVGKENARPLILMTPKSLIRNQRVAVESKDLSDGKFQTILEHERTGDNPDDVKRLVIGSGKIMVDIEEALDDMDQSKGLHCVRLEQIYPFPDNQLKNILKEYKNVEDIVWVQEEPKNMGSWEFVNDRIRDVKKKKQTLHYVGRPDRSSPAVGDPDIHKSEQNQIIEEALKLD